MVRNILMDWDDTLWDLAANSALALNRCFYELHLAEVFGSADNFRNIYHRVNDGLWARYRRGEIDRPQLVARRFGDTLMEAGVCDGALASSINDAYLRNVEHESELVPNARLVVEKLQKKGYRLIVVTNGFREVQLRKLRDSGIAHMFSHVVMSDEAGALKPSAAFFDYVFMKTGAKPHESVMVGDDVDADISGAVGYGLRAIYFNRWGRRCPYDVWREINDLSEIMDVLG